MCVTCISEGHMLGAAELGLQLPYMRACLPQVRQQRASRDGKRGGRARAHVRADAAATGRVPVPGARGRGLRLARAVATGRHVRARAAPRHLRRRRRAARHLLIGAL